MMFGGIDIGSTLTKSVLLQSGGDDAGIVRARIEGATPREPEAILALVQSILTREPDRKLIWAISSFRRAAILDDGGGKEQISWARDAMGLRGADPPPLSGQTAIADNLATAHRWRTGNRCGELGFDTFESWLAEQLIGRRVISESTAWLTGLWNATESHWQAECLTYLGAAEQDLPAVLIMPEVEGYLALPVLGDHQASVLAARALSNNMAFVEVGTALAVVIGNVREDHPLTSVPLLAPPIAGYREFIDPFCSVRMLSEKAVTRLPAWTLKRLHRRSAQTNIRPIAVNSPRAVCHLISDALSVSQSTRSEPLFVSGGFVDANLCQNIADVCQTRVVWQRSISPAIGAALFAAALVKTTICRVHEPDGSFAPQVSPAEAREWEEAWAETIRRETR